MDLGIFKDLSRTRVTAESVQDAIIKAMENRLLQPGEKLQSSRDIALHLGVSRTTVVKALDNLIARGYLVAVQGSGTWVADGSKSSSSAAAYATEPGKDPAPGQLYHWGDRYTSLAGSLMTIGAEKIDSVEFDEINFGSQPPDLIPVKQWRKVLSHLGDSLHTRGFEANKEVFGYRPLREAIAGFLRRNKGIVCDTDQIVLDSGVQSVVSPVFSLLVKAGDLAVCENPGFYGAREQFESLGAHVLPVPVDGEGLVVNALGALGRKPQWLYVAPSCQEPTGVTLSLERRRQLIDWCVQNQTAIIEDDWDSEFHYGGVSAPALFSLDTSASVIYFHSFWRLLYPLCSVGFLVIPRKLIPVFENYKSVWDRQFTLIEHVVLTELLNDGQLEKHLRQTWKYFRKQRQAVIAAMTKLFREKIAVVPSSTGMHVLVRFDQCWTESDIEKSARQAGLPVASTAPYYVHGAQANEFMIRFSDIPEAEVDTRLAALARLLG